MVMGFTENWNGEPTGFVDKIIDGVKWHSMRWGNRWRPGMQITMATGVRTKKYRPFVYAPCEWTQGVKIIPNTPDPRKQDSYLPRVMVERGAMRILMPLAPFSIMALAINDGFESAYDLNRWMLQACRAKGADAFRGQIVAWRPVNCLVMPERAGKY